MTIARPETPRHAPRRRVEISTTALTAHLTQVQTPGEVLGYVRSDWNGYSALRGTHLSSAVLVGCYATHGLALEALRLRPRTI